MLTEREITREISRSMKQIMKTAVDENGKPDLSKLMDAITLEKGRIEELLDSKHEAHIKLERETIGEEMATLIDQYDASRNIDWVTIRKMLHETAGLIAEALSELVGNLAAACKDPKVDRKYVELAEQLMFISVTHAAKDFAEVMSKARVDIDTALAERAAKKEADEQAKDAPPADAPIN